METISEFQGQYRFLSNFFKYPITMEDGITYSTREHAFQAYKTTNLEIRKRIAQLSSPAQAKSFGRIGLTLRENWDLIKDDIMRDIIQTCIKQNPEFKMRLAETGDAHLIEGNTWGDIYWGVCNGEGKNKLGQILMECRSRIQDYK